MFCIRTTTCTPYPFFHGLVCGICSLGNNFTESTYILYRNHIFCLIFLIQVFHFIEILFSDIKRLDETSLFILSHFPLICRFMFVKVPKWHWKFWWYQSLKTSIKIQMCVLYGKSCCAIVTFCPLTLQWIVGS